MALVDNQSFGESLENYAGDAAAMTETKQIIQINHLREKTNAKEKQSTRENNSNSYFCQPKSIYCKKSKSASSIIASGSFYCTTAFACARNASPFNSQLYFVALWFKYKLSYRIIQGTLEFDVNPMDDGEEFIEDHVHI